jgi:hypothetical protein
MPVHNSSQSVHAKTAARNLLHVHQLLHMLALSKYLLQANLAHSVDLIVAVDNS